MGAVAPMPSTIAPSIPGRADRRIPELHRLVASGDYDVLSLDVFDTFVWRRVPAPTDVHLVVAARLRARGALRESSTPESFVRERVEAEVRARRAQPSGEVTLAEIWAAFPRGYLHGFDPAAGPALELEVERALVRPDPEVRALAEAARARGLRVALVSDTYHAASDLVALTGFDADLVLASCEHRLAKYQGLHRHLLERLRVDPARVLHVGDSAAADLEGPAPLGLHRYWLPRWPEAYRDLHEAEMPRSLAARAALLGDGDDGGLTALRGRAMFACATEYERWGAGVLGPLVAGFADWVVGRCAALGIRTVLCLMREGRVLKQALDATGAGLATHETYLSRYVALRAALFDADEHELLAFLRRPSVQSRERVLAQLGLAREDFGATPPPERLDAGAVVALARRVAGDPALQRRVRRASAEARARLLAHLDTRLGGTAGPVAVVDLGYKGTIQGALERILARERPGVTTHGLYFVTGGEVHETQATGAAVEGWLAENGQPIAMAHSFMRSPEIVEQSLMADCGTTLGHDAAGAPVLDITHVPPAQREAIAEVQRGLATWCALWAAHRAEHAVDTAALHAHYRAICMRTVLRPLDIELELFGDWRHDENFGSADVRGIAEVKDLHPWEASHMSAHQLASLPPARVHWPFGFASRIAPGLAEAVAHLYMRSAGPEAFEAPEPPRPLVFYWDAGAGFGPAHAKVLELRMNGRGRAWLRASLNLGPGGVRAVGFSLGTPGTLLRLAGVRVHVRPKGGPLASRSIPHAEVAMHGIVPLHGDLYRVDEDPSLLWVTTGEAEGVEGRLDVDLFVSVLAEAS